MALTITIPGAVEATIGATAPAILTVDVGVPGATGAQGPQGDPGEGVPVGGSSGQALVKVDGTNYNTTWSSLPAFLTKAGNLSGLTDLNTARQNLNLGTTDTPVFGGVDVQGSGANVSHLTPTSLSLIQTGHGQFLIQPSQGIVFPDASVQTAAWNDAPSDGTIYGRQDGDWVEVNVEGDYLPLAGGLMDNDAQISFTATAGGGALLSASSLLLAGGDDITTITPGKVELVFDNVPLPFTIDVNGMTFPDNTLQTTAFTDSYVPLAGGTMTGDLNFSDNVSKVVQSYDDSQGGTIPGDEYYSAYNLTSLSFRTQNYSSDGQGGVDPPTLINGSKLSGYGLSFVNFNGTTRASTMLYGPTSITFGNASVQTIAFPGFNNTALTGNPTAPTATFGDSDTSIATTAFVQAGLAGGTAIARNLEVQVRNQSGSTIPAGSIVYISGATGNLPLITLAQANNDADSAQTMGFTAAAIANNASGYVIVRGECQNLNTSALTEGTQLYLSPTVAGAYTTTKPAAPQHLVYVGIVIRAHPTLGTILVAVQNGYELEELHNVAAQTPANNDLLAYETSTDLWKNKTASTLGLAAINSQAFTGTPSLPTGTTGITQTAGNNTTALATTAFVTAAVPAFATNVQVITGTSGAVTLTPSTIGAQLTRGFSQRFDFISSTSTGGSGAVTTAFAGWREALVSSSVSAGRASFSLGSVGTIGAISGYSDESKIDYSKKIWVAGRASTNFSATYVGDANTSVSCCIGGYNTNMTGNMNVAGIGWRKAGGSGAFVTLMVHNGTTFTTVATTKTVDRLEVFDWLIYSDGSGNVTLYINGVSSATTSSGPTGLGGANQNIYREQCEKTAVATQMLIHSYGGCYYSER